MALAFVFLWFAIGGIAHLVVPEFFLKIVPPGLPLRLQAVYISGIFELLGAGALCLRDLRRRAGIGLTVLTVVVTPANIYMWKNPDLFPAIPEVLLGWRLVFQIVLVVIILWSTWPTTFHTSSRLNQSAR